MAPNLKRSLFWRKIVFFRQFDFKPSKVYYFVVDFDLRKIGIIGQIQIQSVSNRDFNISPIERSLRAVSFSKLFMLMAFINGITEILALVYQRFFEVNLAHKSQVVIFELLRNSGPSGSLIFCRIESGKVETPRGVLWGNQG